MVIFTKIKKIIISANNLEIKCNELRQQNWKKSSFIFTMLIILRNSEKKKYSHIYVKTSSYPQKVPYGKDGNEEIFRCSF